jgi:hypothetical protein
MMNSTNALARAEINFDAQARKPVMDADFPQGKRVEMPTRQILQSVLTDLSF